MLLPLVLHNSDHRFHINRGSPREPADLPVKTKEIWTGCLATVGYFKDVGYRADPFPCKTALFQQLTQSRGSIGSWMLHQYEGPSWFIGSHTERDDQINLSTEPSQVACGPTGHHYKLHHQTPQSFTHYHGLIGSPGDSPGKLASCLCELTCCPHTSLLYVNIIQWASVTHLLWVKKTVRITLS